MSLIFNHGENKMALTQKDLLAGDHIYVRRLLHSHHGIYVGNDRVVHYKGLHKEKYNAVVKKTNLNEFLREGKLRRRDYKERLPREETVRLANQLLNEEKYSLVKSNCEHMATYCVTGKASSRQVKRGTIALVCVGVISALTATLGLPGKERKGE